MASMYEIAPDMARWINDGVRYADQWTGCYASSPNEDCRALHWTAAEVLRDPVRAGLVFAAFWIVRAVLPKLQAFAQARFKAWRDDDKHARFMRGYEAYRGGLLWPFSGFLLGDLARGMLLPLRVRGDASILTYGGARTGKGIGLIIPNCLKILWQVIVDPAAEIVAVCAPVWRRRGVLLFCVNPTGAYTLAPWSLPVHRFNPLALLDPTMPGFGSYCRAVADSLFIRSGQGDPFWIESGVAMADFVIRQVILLHGSSANLIHVYAAILGGLTNQERFFGEMAKSDDPFIKQAGERLLQMLKSGSRTIAGIVAQVETKLAWMADDRFVASLSGHDVDLDALRGRGMGKRGCVIVFVLPPNLAATHGAWLKVCLNAIITAMVEDLPENKVLLTIDECVVLGNWHWIEQGMAILAKYRIQLHAIYQSMGQAQDIFGDKLNSMMSNAHLKNFVGVNDPLTARHLSEALGDKADGTKLMSADQLARMRPGQQISIVRSQRPILVQNRPYYHRFLMRRGVGPNPFHKGMPRLPALYPVWAVKGLLVTLWATARPTTRQAVLMALVGAGFFWWRDAWAMF